MLKELLVARHGLKRLRQGHPWVFANDIVGRLKDFQPGELGVLVSSEGERLAVATINPHSLIAARILAGGDAQTSDWVAYFIDKLLVAANLRSRLGFGGSSHRWIYGEADGLPGLVIDVYCNANGISTVAAQVVVVQILTAGMEYLLRPRLEEVINQAILRLSNDGLMARWENTSIVVRDDSRGRQLEGLEIRKAIVLHGQPGLELTTFQASLRVNTGCDLDLRTNIVEGQKTGLFLDQRDNLRLVGSICELVFPMRRRVKILDLCCYVGQWSLFLAQHFEQRKFPEIDLTLFDSSAPSLKIAAENLRIFRHQAIRGDMMTDLAMLNERFDIIVCDPPALVQSRMHVTQGLKGYRKLNRLVMSLLAPRGLLVTCCCSGLVGQVDFRAIVDQAASDHRQPVQWLAQGQQALDHPITTNFPEGQYLKMMVGINRSD